MQIRCRWSILRLNYSVKLSCRRFENHLLVSRIGKNGLENPSIKRLTFFFPEVLKFLQAIFGKQRYERIVGNKRSRASAYRSRKCGRIDHRLRTERKRNGFNC